HTRWLVVTGVQTCALPIYAHMLVDCLHVPAPIFHPRAVGDLTNLTLQVGGETSRVRFGELFVDAVVFQYFRSKTINHGGDRRGTPKALTQCLFLSRGRHSKSRTETQRGDNYT